jgi:hypothetical protein
VKTGSQKIESGTTDSAACAVFEIPRAEPDLIDRIANALPEELRAEYYRELRHCRSLPENDEMLRLLRAMQFLVLLIEQAPSRVAEERERIDKLLATAVDNISRMSTTTEAYQRALSQKLADLPADIADGISPAAVAGEIREILREEFMRSTIPKTADDLVLISDRMRKVSVEFATTSDRLCSTYGGAAEDARKAVGSLNSEISQATATAARYTREVGERCSKAYRWAFLMVAAGSLVMGLALGMMFERWLVLPPDGALAPATATAKIESAPSGGQPAAQALEQRPRAQKADTGR